MLLGVAPPSDIDRGPFREDSEGDSNSPYGPEFVATCNSPTLELGFDCAKSPLPEMFHVLSTTNVQASDRAPLPNRNALRYGCALNITYGVIRV